MLVVCVSGNVCYWWANWVTDDESGSVYYWWANWVTDDESGSVCYWWDNWVTDGESGNVCITGELTEWLMVRVVMCVLLVS